MAHALASQKTSLRDELIRALKDTKPIGTDLERSAVKNVFDEMLRKLCNTRIQEFLSSLKQKMASNNGHASTSDQNLRDKLLAQHTNLQSRVCM